jgi:RNA polymerase sigma-70 factor, ECF subfamily
MLSDGVTGLLIRWSEGEEGAFDELTVLVYEELRRLAANYLRQERPGHTLQATALVHEAYLQIRKLERVEWKNRAQFVGMSANLMRRILLEHARRRHAGKRGGESPQRVPLDPSQLATERDFNILALDEVLDRMSKQYPRQAQVVEMRFFGGLTNEETADVLKASHHDMSLRTVERDWRFARAWLSSAMGART